VDASQIGKRAWSYAGVLQDAGLSCFEYVEQLTLLLFLKMADQLTEEPYNQPTTIPPELSWKALLPLDGAALEDKYREILEKLALKGGMLGVIFKPVFARREGQCDLLRQDGRPCRSLDR
jgi:type I restriction enzyme M protein